MTRATIRAPLLAAALLLTPAIARAQSVSSPEPSAVHAGTYKVEPAHTQIGFSLSHLGFSTYSGVLSGASGSLVLDPAHVSISKLAISIPVASVQTTSAKLDEELKGAQWLDAAQFPAITFASTSVKRTGARTALVTGNLTLHGVTKPVTLSVALVGSGTNPIDKAYTVGFDATAKITRSEFGVKTYVPLVGDQVTLHIAGAFEQQN